MKKTLCILMTVVMLSALCINAFAEGGNALSFKEDGTFRILHITDSQDDRYPAYDLQNFLKKAVEESKPDLIVFTGDLVEDSRIGDPFNDDDPLREGVVAKKLGEVDLEKTYDNLKTAADNVLSVLQATGIPFALTQGNNDYKCSVTNEQWLEIFSSYSNCLVFDESEDENGRIDYHLEINGKNGSPAFVLWMMDTGTGGVHADQIEWYKTACSAITEENGGTPVPSFVFQHIQTSDIGNLFEECTPFDEGARAEDGKFYRLKDGACGRDFFAYEPGKTSDEFKAWKEQGDVLGAFFGHQHIEGFSGKVDGIELGFTYGCEFAKTGPYGYRIFELNENDITNYKNDLYTYEGSVRLGNDRFEKQENKPYREYASAFEKIIFAVPNFVMCLVSLVVSLFA